MDTFKDFRLSKHLNFAIEDLGFDKPTPIQSEAFPVILSGKDVVGVSQTGTGKTFAFMLPILEELTFSKQIAPRVLILVPTRELVLQVVKNIESYAKYMTIRVLGIYGGANINVQRQYVAQGVDILVATPGRLYDLALTKTLKLKDVKKLVIDEVDIMLDLGFRFQLANIFELLPEKRQNIMFSATMTEEIDELIEGTFITPHKIAIEVSGTPLENIAQSCYLVPNFYTKANLLVHLLKHKDKYSKVLVFVSTKKNADRLFDYVEEYFGQQIGIIHSNKSQNYRIRSVEQFDNGSKRILIATDVMARGLDLDRISHVMNFDTPAYPENYMHRIGRTGRAEEKGETILFSTPKELESKEKIETLMGMKIEEIAFPKEVEISKQLTPDEQPKQREINTGGRSKGRDETRSGFHEKKEKNLKTNQGGSYKFKIKKKYKKRQTRGDKNYNQRNKK